MSTDSIGTSADRTLCMDGPEPRVSLRGWARAGGLLQPQLLGEPGLHLRLSECCSVRASVRASLCTRGHVCAGSLTDQHLGMLLPDGSRVLGQSCADVFQRRWACDVLGVPGRDRGLQKVGRKGEVWSGEGGGCPLDGGVSLSAVGSRLPSPFAPRFRVPGSPGKRELSE